MTATLHGSHPYVDRLQRVLAQHGIEAALPELLSQVGGDHSLERARSMFESRGKDARIVQVTVADLGRLTLPTLLGVKGQPPCLLWQVGLRRVLVERGRDVQRIQLSTFAQDMTGTALEIDGHTHKSSAFLGRVLQLFWAHRGRLFTIGSLTVLVSAMTLVGPALTQHLVDKALPDMAHATLELIALSLLAVALQRALIGYARDRAMRGLEVALSRSVLKNGLARLLAVPLGKLTGRTLGDSLQVLASSEAVSGGLQSLAALTLLDGVRIVTVLGAMYMTFPSLLPLALGVVTLTTVASLLFGLQNQRLAQDAMDAGKWERTRLHEILSGIFTYKSLGAERIGVSRWLAELLNERSASLRRDRNVLWLDTLLQIAQQLTLVCSIYWGGRAALSGSLTIGEVVAGLMLVDQLSAAGRRFASLMVPWIGLVPHVKTVQAVPSEQGSAHKLDSLRPRSNALAIQLADVWFRYGPQEPWLLRGYNLAVAPGEHVRLTGASGMGKTTILRLIAGLYVPERGEVFVNAENPTQASGSVLYLPQASHLFEGSVSDNLRNLSGASHEAVHAAAKLTNLIEWLTTLPMRMDTVLTPGGTNLSGGQRQWILLTAAAASVRPVMLLDEPTSQIDRVTRQRLLFHHLFTDRTLLYTAHDL